MPELTPLERDFVAAATAGDFAETVRLEALVDAEAETKEAALRTPAARAGAALWYADALAVPVFPCQPLLKTPATSHGFKDATRNTATIRQWWQTWPNANLAYPTGIRFDVIDVDGPEGMASLTDLRTSGLLPDVIATAHTPRGLHLYILPTGDGNTTALMPGIDYRGDGGYVLAPPSHFGGEPAKAKAAAKPAGYYRWLDPLTPAKLGAL